MANPRLEAILDHAAHDFDVNAVILFGSTAHGEAAPRDLDVCLVHGEDASRTNLTRKRLEYMEHHDADIQVFQALPLPLRKRVLKEGRALLVKNEDALYQLANRTIRSYTYFHRAYQLYLEGVRSG